MFSASHHGAWRGPNRLWLEGPSPHRCDAEFEVHAQSFRYSWSFDGEPKEGELQLFGPPGSLRARWRDSWHMADGMDLHGYGHDNLVRLFGTYSAGGSPEWGWRIDIDTADPECFRFRMFNLAPDGATFIAVDFAGAR